MSPRPDLSPITSPDDPRLAGMGREDVAGADQIIQLLASSPRERLQYLLDTLDFEERLHQARRIPQERWLPRFQPEEMLRTLERHRVRYVLIGGVAATLHGSPLSTRDADVCRDPRARA